MDSAYPDYVIAFEDDIVPIISSTTKKVKGTWFANFTKNEVVFDSMGVRKITIEVPLTGDKGDFSCEWGIKYLKTVRNIFTYITIRLARRLLVLLLKLVK